MKNNFSTLLTESEQYLQMKHFNREKGILICTFTFAYHIPVKIGRHLKYHGGEITGQIVTCLGNRLIFPLEKTNVRIT